MKALIQRVSSAKVTVDGNIIGSIGQGLCVLLGIARKDTPREMEYMVNKILNLRLFESDGGKRWDKSVVDRGLEVLCVSQFTLTYILKGNKPDFHDAMGPDTSEAFFDEFVTQMGKAYDPNKIQKGQFGAYMQVHIQNDGPVTIQLESPDYLQEPGKQRKPINPPKQKREKKTNSSKDKPVKEQNDMVSVSGEASNVDITSASVQDSLQASTDGTSDLSIANVKLDS